VAAWKVQGRSTSLPIRGGARTWEQLGTDVSLLGPVRADTLMNAWQLGDISLLRNEGRPIQLRRTPRHVRRDAPEVISLNIQTRGSAIHYQEGHTQVCPPSELMMVDLSGSYESNTGLGTLAAYIPYSLLGINVDVGRRALPQLTRSPVYGVTQRHLTQLEHDIDKLSSSTVAPLVGEATIQLVRALLLSAAADRGHPDALHETLILRVTDYIRKNMHDNRLDPARIARAHHISIRTLYNLWSTHETSLMEWITQERLHRARGELADVTSSPSVASVARRCGFVNPTHFSRRFHDRYGMTPTEWRNQHETHMRGSASEAAG
jgi:AraC-like DNA-binding protein